MGRGVIVKRKALDLKNKQTPGLNCFNPSLISCLFLDCDPHNPLPDGYWCFSDYFLSTTGKLRLVQNGK